MNGYSWTQTSLVGTNWKSVASNIDGTKLVACNSLNQFGDGPSNIYTSNDSGLNWTQSTDLATTINWISVASSSNGNNLVACSDRNLGSGGGIFTSSNSGLTWTKTSAFNLAWTSVASNSDGIKLIACAYPGNLYISTDSGSNWTSVETSGLTGKNWTSVASSSDGNILLACGRNVGIWISFNSGLNWTQTLTINSSWESVDLSSEGSTLIACSSTASIEVYKSTNSGSSWNPAGTPTNRAWYSVASDSDGSVLAAGPQSFKIYTSYNSGSNWKDNTSSTNKWWTKIASNSDGTKLVACARNFGIYTATLITVPSAPTNLVATPSDSSAIITFDQISNGGSAITGYNYSLNDGAYISTSFITSPITITGLTNGISYNITLQAVNIEGISAASSSVTVTPVTVPGAPTNLSAKSGDQIAIINFTTPSDNGGSTIIDYEYSLNDGEYISTSSTNSPIIITGLTNDESYSVKLVAVNSEGQGTASDPITVIPKIPIPCFKEGTKIHSNNGYIPIENLRKGDYIKTLNHGFLPIVFIGKREIIHSHSNSNFRDKNKLYNCSPNKYQDLFEDLIITGCHSILIDEFVSEDQRQKTKEINGDLYITNNMYRLPACVDERADIYKISGKYIIYHLALENDSYYNNYGIYANGLLVESCSKRYLKELSNMELIE